MRRQRAGCAGLVRSEVWFLLLTVPAVANVVTIGLFYPLTGHKWGDARALAALMAIRDAQNGNTEVCPQMQYLKSLNVTYILKDTKNIPHVAEDIARDMLEDSPQVVVLIGPSSSDSVAEVAPLMNSMSPPIPVVGFAATDPELSKKEKYGNFFRLVPNDGVVARGMVATLQCFGASDAIGLFANAAYPQGIREMFIEYSTRAGITFQSKVYTLVPNKKPELDKAVEFARQVKAKAILLVGKGDSDTVYLFQRFYMEHLLSGRFVLSGDLVAGGGPMNVAAESMGNVDASTMFQKVFSFKRADVTTEYLQEFNRKWNQRVSNQHWDSKILLSSEELEEPPSYAVESYESVVFALTAILKQREHQVDNLMQAMKLTVMEGFECISGEVKLDTNHDRQVESISVFRYSDGVNLVVGKFNVDQNDLRMEPGHDCPNLYSAGDSAHSASETDLHWVLVICIVLACLVFCGLLIYFQPMIRHSAVQLCKTTFCSQNSDSTMSDRTNLSLREIPRAMKRLHQIQKKQDWTTEHRIREISNLVRLLLDALDNNEVPRRDRSKISVNLFKFVAACRLSTGPGSHDDLILTAIAKYIRSAGFENFNEEEADLAVTDVLQEVVKNEYQSVLPELLPWMIKIVGDIPTSKGKRIVAIRLLDEVRGRIVMMSGPDSLRTGGLDRDVHDMLAKIEQIARSDDVVAEAIAVGSADIFQASENISSSNLDKFSSCLMNVALVMPVDGRGKLNIVNELYNVVARRAPKADAGVSDILSKIEQVAVSDEAVAATLASQCIEHLKHFGQMSDLAFNQIVCFLAKIALKQPDVFRIVFSCSIYCDLLLNTRLLNQTQSILIDLFGAPLVSNVGGHLAVEQDTATAKLANFILSRPLSEIRELAAERFDPTQPICKALRVLLCVEKAGTNKQAMDFLFGRLEATVRNRSTFASTAWAIVLAIYVFFQSRVYDVRLLASRFMVLLNQTDETETDVMAVTNLVFSKSKLSSIQSSMLTLLSGHFDPDLGSDRPFTSSCGEFFVLACTDEWGTSEEVTESLRVQIACSLSFLIGLMTMRIDVRKGAWEKLRGNLLTGFQSRLKPADSMRLLGVLCRTETCCNEEIAPGCFDFLCDLLRTRPKWCGNLGLDAVLKAFLGGPNNFSGLLSSSGTGVSGIPWGGSAKFFQALRNLAGVQEIGNVTRARLAFCVSEFIKIENTDQMGMDENELFEYLTKFNMPNDCLYQMWGHGRRLSMKDIGSRLNKFVEDHQADLLSVARVAAGPAAGALITRGISAM